MTETILPITWFEERVGKLVFRNPVYDFEKDNKEVPVKIRDVEHAHVLHSIHVNNTVIYRDHETK
jgi:hypothetical protein